MIGTVLGNRYRLDQLIGEGGMGLVYRAECSLLQRPVAVKVLRPQFASDVEFVERFRREAQAAARLSHHNVVNVYDVGQDHGLNYIVMEYVRGDNLKDLIKKEAPFTVARSLSIARQICEALHHAHQNNIVHRDIKPHNILIASDGRVKVTDFGIARAVSASTLTQSGSVMGSVQYFSPEQAKGAPTGAVSDLYSLGCVLYEMLTGTVPFKGETPIAIALKHLQDQPVSLHVYRPDIPAAMERLVARALAKDPSLRFPSALAMLKEIQAIQGSDRLAIPIERDADLPTQVLPTLPGKPDNKRMLRIALGFFALIVVAMGVFFWYVLYWSVPKPIRVPNLVGLLLPAARERAREVGFTLKAIARYDDTEIPNKVLAQDPVAGMTVRERQIAVTVSSGPRKIPVPDLVGASPEEAKIALEDVGLVYNEGTERRPSKSIEEGKVTEQDPAANEEVPIGGTVTVYLSMGDKYILKESFVDLLLTEAAKRLDKLGLAHHENYESSEKQAGTVLRQTPAPYEPVAMGTVVQLYVSSGPLQLENGQL